MNSSLLKNTAVYTSVNIISRGISFFLLPLYTAVLTPTDYGTLDLLLIFGYFVNLSIALEISQAVARFYAPEKDEIKKTTIASSAFWFSIVTYFSFSCLALALNSEISLILFGKENQEHFFKIGLIYFFFNGLFMFVQNQLRWQQRSKAYALVSLSYSICTAFFSILLAYIFRYGLSGILIGMSLGACIGFLIGILKLKKTIRWKLDTFALREMLMFSIPLVPASIAVFVSNYFDRLMINQFLSLKEVGLYGAAFRISSIVSFVVKGISGAFTPFVFKNFEEKETPELIAKVFRYFTALILIIFAVLAGMSSEITSLLTSEEFHESHRLIIFLVPAIVLTYMYLFTPGLSIAKKTRVILLINLFGAAINIPLNLILIPLHGVYGAALATLSAYFVVFLVNMYFSQKYYHVPHKWIPLILSSVLTIVLCLIASTVRMDNFVFYVVKAMILSSLCLVMFILTNLIHLSELKNVFAYIRRRSKNTIN